MPAETDFSSPHLPLIDYANHPAYGLMFEPDPELGALAHETLQPFIEEMTRCEQLRSERFGSRYRHETSIGEELATKGFSRLLPGPALFNPVEAAAAPVVALVRARLDQAQAEGAPISFKLAQELLDKGVHPALWTATEALLGGLGVLDVCQTYFSASGAKLKAAAVMVNRPGQSWSAGVFRDVELETPPTNGFHVDSDGQCILKTVVYLNDVGPDQGPFGLVPMSHAWEEGGVGRIYRRAFDKSPLASRAGAKRRAFLSLPKEMQVKAEFGGDMLAGSPQAQALLAQEAVQTGPKGQVNLFDPEAIHRGGHVRSGERLVLLTLVAARWW